MAWPPHLFGRWLGMLHTRYACLTKGVWPAEGDVLVADRGLRSYAHVALLVQAGVHTVRRAGARQIVDVTPGRPFVRPSVRRMSTVKGFPRSLWLKALSVHDQLVV
jgi:hypothetical protein